ncbi:MAG: class I SAM-dependent methyltransferase [bacterium]
MNERVFTHNVDRLRNPERKERLEVKHVVDLLFDNQTIHSVLDIGTGSGLFAEEFNKRNIIVSGIDLQPEMIELAKGYLPECKFEVAAAEDIPFENESFDIAFFGLVFHEVDDYTKALTEAKRVAVKEVAVLEWNYKTEETGPPLEHRINPDFIEQLSIIIGFKQFEAVVLKNLTLYRLKI